MRVHSVQKAYQHNDKHPISLNLSSINSTKIRGVIQFVLTLPFLFNLWKRTLSGKSTKNSQSSMNNRRMGRISQRLILVSGKTQIIVISKLHVTSYFNSSNACSIWTDIFKTSSVLGTFKKWFWWFYSTCSLLWASELTAQKLVFFFPFFSHLFN